MVAGHTERVERSKKQATLGHRHRSAGVSRPTRSVLVVALTRKREHEAGAPEHDGFLPQLAFRSSARKPIARERGSAYPTPAADLATNRNWAPTEL